MLGRNPKPFQRSHTPAAPGLNAVTGSRRGQ